MQVSLKTRLSGYKDFARKFIRNTVSLHLNYFFLKGCVEGASESEDLLSQFAIKF